LPALHRHISKTSSFLNLPNKFRPMNFQARLF
jgi:hypothetical protein